MVERWERQSGEGARAFEAFCIYRDMGPDRSQRAVADTLGKSKTLISRWSAENEWVERVREYENHLDRMETERRKRDLQRTRKRRADIADRILDAVADRLASMSADDLKKVSLRSLAEIMKLASDVQETALGPTQEELQALTTDTGNEFDWGLEVERAFEYDAAHEDFGNG